MLKQMANLPKSETVSTVPTRPSWPLPACSWSGPWAPFYALGQQDLWLRVAVLLLMLCGGGVFFTSENGSRLIAFGRDAVREIPQGRLADRRKRCR